MHLPEEGFFNRRRFSRRRLITGGLVGVPGFALGEAFGWGPEAVRVRRHRLVDRPSVKLLHFTDLHHKGDGDYLAKVVGIINREAADLVCFTGDLIEEGAYLKEALEGIRAIRAPVYGVPGNHDYWAQVSFDPFYQAFAATGGAFLVDQQATTRDGRLEILGLTGGVGSACRPVASRKNVVLVHYPRSVDELSFTGMDLLLAGHSHGGQVRLPGMGPLILPTRVGRYDLGLFETPAGPLYVGAGIGWFHLRVRFLCRPEVTVFEL